MDLEKRAPALARLVVDARERLLDQSAALGAGVEACRGFGDGMHAGALPNWRSISIGRSRGNSSFDLPRSPATLQNAIHLGWKARASRSLSYPASPIGCFPRRRCDQRGRD